MKRTFCTLTLALALSANALCASPMFQVDSLSYAFGVFYGNTLKDNRVQSISPTDFMRGLNDGYAGQNPNVAMTKEQAMEFINSYMRRQYDLFVAQNLAEGRLFLEQNRTKDGIVTDGSGLQYMVVRKGNGVKPKATDKVLVHYRGMHINGEVFDSSYDREEPISFELNRVIKGWTIGVQLMDIGSKFIFYIPTELAYGSNVHPDGPIRPNEALVFEIELLDIVNDR